MCDSFLVGLYWYSDFYQILMYLCKFETNKIDVEVLVLIATKDPSISEVGAQPRPNNTKRNLSKD